MSLQGGRVSLVSCPYGGGRVSLMSNSVPTGGGGRVSLVPCHVTRVLCPDPSAVQATSTVSTHPTGMLSCLIYFCPTMKLREGNVFSRVCPSFWPQRSPHVTISHDALDLTVQAPLSLFPAAPTPLDIGLVHWTSLYSPPPRTDTSDGHTVGKRAVSIQLECFLVSNITNVNSTLVSKYYFQQLLTNAEVLTFEGSSAPSVQYQPSISVTSLPSQTQLTVDRSDILDEQSNSNNLVIMDSTSDGTSILDMDSGLTGHS